MSKKETRRAARQSFPKASGGKAPSTTRTKGSYSGAKRSSTGKSKARPALKPPTIKRAAIQGAILAVLYMFVMRFIESETSWIATIIFSLAGFIVYTAIAYGIDKFTYQRKLRKLKGSSK